MQLEAAISELVALKDLADRGRLALGVDAMVWLAVRQVVVGIGLLER
jgi:hypothetical protein